MAKWNSLIAMADETFTWRGDDIVVDRRFGDALDRLTALERALFAERGPELLRQLTNARAPLTEMTAELVRRRGANAPLTLQAQTVLAALLMRRGETEAGQALAVATASAARLSLGPGSAIYARATAALSHDLAVPDRAEAALQVFLQLDAPPMDLALARAAAFIALREGAAARTAISALTPTTLNEELSFEMIAIEATMVEGRFDAAMADLKTALTRAEVRFGRNSAEYAVLLGWSGWAALQAGSRREAARRLTAAETALTSQIKRAHPATLTIALRRIQAEAGSARRDDLESQWADLNALAPQVFAINDPRRGLVFLVGATISAAARDVAQARLRLNEADRAWAGQLVRTHPIARERAAFQI